MFTQRTYQVFLDDKLIMEGTVDEVSSFLGVGLHSIYRLAALHLLNKDGYTVIKKGTMPREEERYLLIKKHLLKLGNTVCNKKGAEKVFNRLKEEGVEFEARSVKDKEDGSYYVLEVPCKTRESKRLKMN